MRVRDVKKKGETGRKPNYSGPYLKVDRIGEQFYVEIGDQRRKTKGSKLAE